MNFKYNEEEILREVKEYIRSTYGEHYAHKDIQVQDLFQSIGIASDFCRGNAMKYLARYGKKNGVKDKKDLFKAIHYIILLITSEENNENKRNH
jgi:hypothetical protein